MDNDGILVPWEVDMRLELGVKMLCVETGFAKVWLEFKLTVDEPPEYWAVGCMLPTFLLWSL